MIYYNNLGHLFMTLRLGYCFLLRIVHFQGFVLESDSIFSGGWFFIRFNLEVFLFVDVEIEHHLTSSVWVERTELYDGLTFGVVLFEVFVSSFIVGKFGRQSCVVVSMGFL